MGGSSGAHSRPGCLGGQPTSSAIPPRPPPRLLPLPRRAGPPGTRQGTGTKALARRAPHVLRGGRSAPSPQEPRTRIQGQGTCQGGRLMSCGGGRSAPSRSTPGHQNPEPEPSAKALARESASCLAGGPFRGRAPRNPEPGSRAKALAREGVSCLAGGPFRGAGHQGPDQETGTKALARESASCLAGGAVPRRAAPRPPRTPPRGRSRPRGRGPPGAGGRGPGAWGRDRGGQRFPPFNSTFRAVRMRLIDIAASWRRSSFASAKVFSRMITGSAGTPMEPSVTSAARFRSVGA